MDNRTKKQRLFSAPATPRAAVKKKDKNAKKKTGAVIQDLFEFATRVVAPVAAVVQETPREEVAVAVHEPEKIDLHETQAMPWTPKFDPHGASYCRALLAGLMTLSKQVANTRCQKIRR